MCTLVGENDQCAHGQDLLAALLHPDAAAAGQDSASRYPDAAAA